MTAKSKRFIIICCILFVLGWIMIINSNKDLFFGNHFSNDVNFKILSTIENKDMEATLLKLANENDIKLTIDYAEDLEIVSKINSGEEYNAIWMSNSLWSYQIENAYLKNSKSTSITPVVMGIKKSKAQELGFINTKIRNVDILNAIKDGKLKYVMSSAVKTNTGASAYLGFLNSLAGSPEVLKSEMLQDQTLKNNMVNFFNGLERVSGTEEFLEEMFLKSNNYEAVIAAETSLININKQLEEQNKEPLYLIYPEDGVAISDSPFIYIDSEKEEMFKIFQDYLLSEEGQNELLSKGRRTWYGGVNSNTPKDIFNPEWGIDTNDYLIPLKYPSKKVIAEATNLYIEEFRKPSHTIFLLDYSGSMYGEGHYDLVNAMSYILDYKEASKEYIQFSSKDKITVIPFTAYYTDIWSTNNGKETEDLILKIKSKNANGGTNIYDPARKAIDILASESNDYTKTIILMTDGQSEDYYSTLKDHYYATNTNIPIYSIMFGSSSELQLEQIAKLTNAKVFDGRTNLLEAFKEVRGFN